MKPKYNLSDRVKTPLGGAGIVLQIAVHREYGINYLIAMSGSTTSEIWYKEEALTPVRNNTRSCSTCIHNNVDTTIHDECEICMNYPLANLPGWTPIPLP